MKHLLITSLSFLASCNVSEVGNTDVLVGDKENDRIDLVYSKIIDGHRYSIVKVDSSEYLIVNSAGVLKLN